MIKQIISLVCFLFLGIHFINAQNVGINTTTPHSSAALDITSVNRGLLTPRMTLAQRNNIFLPATGLLIYQTDNTPGFYYYSGSAWIRLITSGFTLPYSSSDVSPTSFAIENNSLSNYSRAIYGKTIANESTSIYGENIGTNGSAIFGFATGTNSNSVDGVNSHNSGTAISGKNTSGGNAIYGSTNSFTGHSAIRGDNNGNSGNAVHGVANASTCTGVRGESNNGIGVLGYSGSNFGVSGSTLSGTALYGNSLSGFGLQSVGKVRLSGGNMNPVDGGVLTSDASGNAVWKPTKVGFTAGVPNATTMNFSVWVDMIGLNQYYDQSNNFNPTGSPSDPNTFIAPVSGLYHFMASYKLSYISSVDNLQYCELRFLINGLGGRSHISNATWNTSVISFANIETGEFIHLDAGDKVRVQMRQYNEGSDPVECSDKNFSGVLIFAD